jgi:hypothetical protein
MEEKFTQKYTVVQLLEDLSVGDTFSATNWPLHVTVSDLFAIPLSIEEITALITEVASHHAPFTAPADKIEHLGPNKDIEVTTLKLTNELKNLHTDLITTLASNGATFNNSGFTLEGFKPHATAKPNNRLEVGTTINFSTLALIDMFPDKNGYKRQVLKLLPLLTS